MAASFAEWAMELSGLLNLLDWLEFFGCKQQRLGLAIEVIKRHVLEGYGSVYRETDQPGLERMGSQVEDLKEK